MPATWHPRGEATWPEWREAVPGETRVRHVRSGMTGTFKRWPNPAHSRKRNPTHATITWDNGYEGRVVAYAFDLEVIE